MSEFYSQNKKRANGEEYIYYAPYCKKCNIKKAKECQYKNYTKQLERMRIRNKLPEVKENRKKYANSEKWKKTFKNWQNNNKDKIKDYNFHRKMNKEHTITDKERNECKMYFNNECAYCGISDELHKQINEQQLHMDHVDPNGANDLSNNIPACKSCNSSKGTYELEEWYSKQSFFNQDKLDKIYTWLNSDYEMYIKPIKQKRPYIRRNIDTIEETQLN